MAHAALHVPPSPSNDHLHILPVRDQAEGAVEQHHCARIFSARKHAIRRRYATESRGAEAAKEHCGHMILYQYAAVYVPLLQSELRHHNPEYSWYVGASRAYGTTVNPSTPAAISFFYATVRRRSRGTWIAVTFARTTHHDKRPIISAADSAELCAP